MNLVTFLLYNSSHLKIVVPFLRLSLPSPWIGSLQSLHLSVVVVVVVVFVVFDDMMMMLIMMMMMMTMMAVLLLLLLLLLWRLTFLRISLNGGTS